MARTKAQKRTVLNAQADHHFERREYDRAAAHYIHTQRPLEEICLKFIHAGQTDALRTYLLARLDGTSTDTERPQRTMLATWLVELYSDKLTNLKPVVDIHGSLLLAGRVSLDPQQAGSGGGGGGGGGGGAPDVGKHAELSEEFSEFLEAHVGCLDAETTLTMLASHSHSAQ
jgi:hypothetical protein